jgi:Holliday junction DNA helicase RuvB
MNIFKLFSNKREIKTEELFDDIIGHGDVKMLFRMALNSHEQVSILLSGPPASAKTMFLESLGKLKSSYFVDGTSTTKSGLIDCLFLNNPKYLLIDR